MPSFKLSWRRGLEWMWLNEYIVSPLLPAELFLFIDLQNIIQKNHSHSYHFPPTNQPPNTSKWVSATRSRTLRTPVTAKRTQSTFSRDHSCLQEHLPEMEGRHRTNIYLSHHYSASNQQQTNSSDAKEDTVADSGRNLPCGHVGTTR